MPRTGVRGDRADVDATQDGRAVDLGVGRTGAPREVCDMCGNAYSVPFLYQHRRRDHGVYGGRTGRTRRNPGETEEQLQARLVSTKKAAKKASKKAATKAGGESPGVAMDWAQDVRSTRGELIPAVELRRNNRQPSFKVMPFVVLEDHEGGMWIAERIR